MRNYYATISNNPADLVIESPDIFQIIITVQAAIRAGFTVKISPEARDEIVAKIEEGNVWAAFQCPECWEELTITRIENEQGDVELGCENGHGWTVGIAFSDE